ncbi:MAG: thioredoxin domain-containing protein [Patescibacteria group bacterium]
MFSIIVLMIVFAFNIFLDNNFLESKINENNILLPNADQFSNDPYVTKADDFYASFIHEHNVVWQNGNLQVQVFCDFLDSECKKVWQDLQQIRSEGIKVSIAWKHFPILFEPVSQSASRAVLCAKEQDFFWEFGDLIFTKQETLNEIDFADFVKELNMDNEKFESCFNNENILELIGQDMEDAQKLLVSDFPYTIAGYSRVDKSKINNLKNIILSELNK